MVCGGGDKSLDGIALTRPLRIFPLEEEDDHGNLTLLKKDGSPQLLDLLGAAGEGAGDRVGSVGKCSPTICVVSLCGTCSDTLSR
jgi:hypothetical protein